MRPTLLLIYVSAVIEIVCSTDHPKRRAPLGFTGVRGKKSITDEDASYAEVSQSLADADADPQASSSAGNVDKRAPSGFMGMRGKKPFPDPDEFPDDVIKRTPSGFFGMRGKKDMELDNLDDYNKRAQYGFVGMRGKKELENPFDTDKRAPSGFMGMRGKKTYESYIDDLKRAQMSGFFGMRGKKSRSGFFGMRGKKYPYEFRGKFVGVRGKKSNVVDAENQENNDVIDMNQLMLLLTANNRQPFGNGSSDLGPV